MDDATALSQRIARRELSCVELMRACLERIEAVNPALNAIVSLRDGDELLAEAAERDAELARGERRGWMHGLPHAIKDLEETAGIVTTSGSPLFADFVPAADSEVARRIRGAGAIVIGKTNVPEFGYGSQTYNDVFGPTRNPYDLARTAGGSSGGAAAALAAGLVPVADGSDYMGSLRNPAAFCNVYGFRPSLGRVGSPPPERAFEAPIGTAGPMARSPRDLAALLATLAGPHPELPFSIDEDPAGLAAPLEPADPARLRIGWLGDLGGHLPFEPGILELCEAALGALGAEVVPVGPGFDPAAAWDAAVTLRHFDATWALELPRERLKPEIRWEAEGALAVTGPGAARGPAHADRGRRGAAGAAARPRRAGAAQRPGLPVRRGDPLAARDRRAADADLPPLDGGRDPRVAGRAARRRRAGRVRAGRAADGHAADRPPARRPRAARAHRGLRPRDGLGTGASARPAPLGSPP